MTQVADSKPKTSRPLRIGELLIKADLLSKSELDEAIGVAGETGMPVGRVLIMSDYLSEVCLQAAEALVLVKSKGVCSARS